MKHLPLQVAVHLVEREFNEPTKLLSPGLDDIFRNNFDSIGIGGIKGNGSDVATVASLANAVVEQTGRQELRGRFQGNRIRSALSQLSQPVDKGLDRFGAKTVLAQRILKGPGRGREIDAGQRTGSFILRSD